MNCIPRFFLGASSADGFVSYFDQLQEQGNPMQLIILKGGPGSGKSTLMKKVLKKATEQKHELEIIPCASDPSSLDAIIDYTAGFQMADGTAPHTIDPFYPGAKQHIIYTGKMWDSKKLKKDADSIEKLTNLISDCHKSARAYIKAAAALLEENRSFSGKYVRRKDASLLCEQWSKNLHGKKTGKKRIRLLSAVSVNQTAFFPETVSCLADEIHIVSDKYGGCADFMIEDIYRRATLLGEEMIVCPCSVIPGKIDHIIFPESRVAVVRENELLKFGSGERVDASSFYSTLPMGNRLEARTKSAAKLLVSAGENVGDAKLLHDELESFYVSAMDFGRTSELLEEITLCTGMVF